MDALVTSIRADPQQKSTLGVCLPALVWWRRHNICLNKLFASCCEELHDLGVGIATEQPVLHLQEEGEEEMREKRRGRRGGRGKRKEGRRRGKRKEGREREEEGG